jgi:HD-like signal output (HDOD) protein
VIIKQISDMLRQLFRSNARTQKDETAQMAARLEQRVLALVDNMPTLPSTAARALSLANDPNSRFAEFARLIEGDAAIATGLLRIANSPYYNGGSPAVKLQQAVVRLGLWQCKSLIVSIGMKSLFNQIAGDARAQCEVLWHHGSVTGFLCRRLNLGFRLGFDGEEFSAGLLHDLGRILLVLADPECADRAGALEFQEGADQLERERAAIGIDHGALGGWFGAHSKLPSTLIQAMRHHHQPAVAEDSERLVTLVAAADHLANSLQLGEDASTYDPEFNVGLQRLCSRWPEGRKERLLGELPVILEESVQAAAGEQAIC